MQAGELNEIIYWESPDRKKNEYGEVKELWIFRAKTRSKVVQNGQNRTTENDEVVFNTSVQFIIRIYHKVEPTDRIVWEGKRYRITGIERQKPEQRQIINAELINE